MGYLYLYQIDLYEICSDGRTLAVDKRSDPSKDVVIATSSLLTESTPCFFVMLYSAQLNSLNLGWMNRRFCIQKGCNQEHISLTTALFCFQRICIHRPSLTQIVHKFFSSFWYVYLLRLAISTCVLCKDYSRCYFPFNSWLSFQRLCRLLWGYHFHFVGCNRGSYDSMFPIPSWHSWLILCLF